MIGSGDERGVGGRGSESGLGWERFVSRCAAVGIEVERSGEGGGVSAGPRGLGGGVWEIPVYGGVDGWVGVARVSVEEAGVPLVARMLEGLFAECCSGAESAADAASVTDRLATGFEELTLLLKLVGSMPLSEGVVDFASTVRNELVRGLRYEWSAVCVLPSVAGIHQLLDGVAVSGMPACGAEAVEQFIELAMPRVEHESTVVLVGEDCGGVAPLSGQVIGRALRVNGVVVGGLFLGECRSPLGRSTSSDVKVVEAAGSMLSGMIRSSLMTYEQERMFVATVQTVVASIEAKDPYTCGHASRVGHLSERLALAAGWTEAEAARARLAGLFHDVGKVGISDEIIRAPGRLTDEQFEQIKLHPEIGHHILSGLPGLEDILPAVLYHHERMDGGGYPRGISGDQIPMIARIVCLADAFDAMSSNRQYRSKMGRDEVLAELVRCKGTHFDPDLVDAFVERVDLTMFDEMIAHPERFKKPSPIIERAQAYFDDRGDAGEDRGRRAA